MDTNNPNSSSNPNPNPSTLPPHRRPAAVRPGVGTGTGITAGGFRNNPPSASTATSINDSGFTLIENLTSRPRLTLSTGGREKTGKTRFMLTAPGPIYYFNLDRPLEPELLAHAKAHKKQVWVKDYFTDVAAKLPQSDYAKIWERYLADWDYACRNARTVIQDTGTAVWELCRLARFGKLSQISPHHYGPVNAEFDKMLRLPRLFDGLNVIISHRYKKEYKGPGAKIKPTAGAADGEPKEMWTGNFERQGYGGTPYEMQVVVEHFQSQAVFDVETSTRLTYTGADQYGIRVVSSGIAGDTLTGTELRGMDCNFQMLGLLAYPESTMEDWI